MAVTALITVANAGRMCAVFRRIGQLFQAEYIGYSLADVCSIIRSKASNHC